MAFLYLVDTVIAESGGILIIGEERSHTIAIVAVQAITCSKPDISPGITEYTIHCRIR